MAKLPSEELLRQEVEELTDLLRHSVSFADLREALPSKGLTSSDVVLAGLIEGEDESRYGVILTRDHQCIRFEEDAEGSLTNWELVDDLGVLTSDFQAVSVGLSMIRRGEIS